MTKIFYDSLIKIEEVYAEFDEFEMEDEEKNEFLSLIDETFHNRTLDVILSNLPAVKHNAFLESFQKEPFNMELLNFLKREIKDDIEEIIQKEAQKIKKEILLEIKRAKKK